MTKQEALQYFWSRHAKAFEETDVPDYDPSDPNTPNVSEGYITYQKIEGEFESPVGCTGSIYHRSPSWKGVEQIKNSISDDLKRGGMIIPVEGGKVWITKGSPFAQSMDDSDRSVRRLVINLMVEFMTE